MALAGHAKTGTTARDIEGHEEVRPVVVNTDLSLDQVDMDKIDWKKEILPDDIAKLIEMIKNRNVWKTAMNRERQNQRNTMFLKENLVQPSGFKPMPPTMSKLSIMNRN